MSEVPGTLRAVLDTNVLLDLWLFDEPSVRGLREALACGRLRAVRSGDCDAELEGVIRRQQFGLAPAECAKLLQRWSACSDAIASVEPAPITCTDPGDQKFLDLAFSAGADLLLTRDKALLALAAKARAAGLAIRSPAAAMTYDRR